MGVGGFRIALDGSGQVVPIASHSEAESRLAGLLAMTAHPLAGTGGSR